MFLIVKTKNKITITFENDTYIHKIGEEIPDLKGIFKAYDSKKNDVTSEIIIDTNAIKWEIFGKYYAYFYYKNKIVGKIFVQVIHQKPFFTNYVDLIFYLDDSNSINYFATDIRAYDCYGKDITYNQSGKRQIQLDDSKVDYKKIGKYYAYYEITDGYGNIGRQEITVDIRKKDVKPVIYGLEDVLYLELNSTISMDILLSGISAFSNQGQDITRSIVVNYDDVNINVSGEYIITYEVVDNSGNYVKVERKAVVLKKDEPIIIGLREYLLLKIGDYPSDFFSNLKAYDYLDKDITSSIDIKVLSLKTSLYHSLSDLEDSLIHENGEYNLIIEVTNSKGVKIVEEVYLVIWNDLTAPVITIDGDIIYVIGEEIPDYFLGVKAKKIINSKLSIDLTDAIEVMVLNPENPSEVMDLEFIDYLSTGVYTLVYSVTDEGNKTTSTRKLVILDQDKPLLYNLPEKFYYYIDPDNQMPIPDYKYNVYAWDFVDCDLTGSIEVFDDNVDYLNEGIYKVIYKVSDCMGNTTIEEVEVEIIMVEK